MFRCCVTKSLPTSPPLSPFYLTTFKGKTVTRNKHIRLTTSVLKSRRLYSSAVPVKQESLVGVSNDEELLLPGLDVATPMISKRELEKYFYPLFCRGWDIKRLSEAGVEHLKDQHESPLAEQTPFLVHKFRFKGSRSARTFLNEIFGIESVEKHHISFNLWSEERPVITVMIQTHLARRLDEKDRVIIDGIEPGLTIRDIRFAVQLENLLDSPTNSISRIPYSTNDSGTDRATAWRELLSKYPFRAPEPTKSNFDNSNRSSPNILETLSMLARQ